MTSHRPDLCFTGVCNNVWVKDTVGRLNHYRLVFLNCVGHV